MGEEGFGAPDVTGGDFTGEEEGFWGVGVEGFDVLFEFFELGEGGGEVGVVGAVEVGAGGGEHGADDDAFIVEESDGVSVFFVKEVSERGEAVFGDEDGGGEEEGEGVGVFLVEGLVQEEKVEVAEIFEFGLVEGLEKVLFHHELNHVIAGEDEIVGALLAGGEFGEEFFVAGVGGVVDLDVVFFLEVVDDGLGDVGGPVEDIEDGAGGGGVVVDDEDGDDGGDDKKEGHEEGEEVVAEADFEWFFGHGVLSFLRLLRVSFLGLVFGFGFWLGFWVILGFKVFFGGFLEIF